MLDLGRIGSNVKDRLQRLVGVEPKEYEGSLETEQFSEAVTGASQEAATEHASNGLDHTLEPTAEQPTGESAPTEESGPARELDLVLAETPLSAEGAASLRNIADQYEKESQFPHVHKEDGSTEVFEASREKTMPSNYQSLFKEVVDKSGMSKFEDGVVQFGHLGNMDVRGADLSGFIIAVEPGENGRSMRLEDFLLNCSKDELARVMPAMIWQSGNSDGYSETVFSADAAIQKKIVERLNGFCEATEVQDPAPQHDLRNLAIGRSELLYKDLWAEVPQVQNEHSAQAQQELPEGSSEQDIDLQAKEIAERSLVTLTYHDFKAKELLTEEYLHLELDEAQKRGLCQSCNPGDWNTEQIERFVKWKDSSEQEGSAEQTSEMKQMSATINRHLRENPDQDDDGIRAALCAYVNERYEQRAQELRKADGFVESEAFVEMRNSSPGEITAALTSGAQQEKQEVLDSSESAPESQSAGAKRMPGAIAVEVGEPAEGDTSPSLAASSESTPAAEKSVTGPLTVQDVNGARMIPALESPGEGDAISPTGQQPEETQEGLSAGSTPETSQDRQTLEDLSQRLDELRSAGEDDTGHLPADKHEALYQYLMALGELAERAEKRELDPELVAFLDGQRDWFQSEENQNFMQWYRDGREGESGPSVE